MKKLTALMLAVIGCLWLWFAGCDNAPPGPGGTYTPSVTEPPPFLEEVENYLANSPNGQSPDNPVELAAAVDAPQLWQLGNAIRSSDKFAALDLSQCGGLDRISNRAFEDCTNLTRVILPEGLASINDSAFEGCTGLTEIDLPASLTLIRHSAFGNYDRLSPLTRVICRSADPPYAEGGVFGYGHTDGFRIEVPAASVAAYKAADGWSGYASRIFAME
jgi:hypothetical protein